jgi:hypothetical protein
MLQAYSLPPIPLDLAAYLSLVVALLALFLLGLSALPHSLPYRRERVRDNL